MNAPIWLVSRREVVERLRARSFLISTGIYLVVALASVIVPHLAGDQRTVYGIGLASTGAGPAIPTLERSIGELAPSLGVDVRTRRLVSPEEAIKAVRDGHLTVSVIDGARLVTRKDLPDKLALLLNTTVYQVKLAERLGAAGISVTDTAALLNPSELPVQRVVEARPIRESNRPLAFAGVLIIYLVLLTYGFTVANGVLEEKSSRVSEILLGALRPTQLLAGKVVGIGVVAIAQLLLIGIPTAAVGLALGSLDLPSGTPLTLAAVFMWAVLGYGLYSCIFAAAGAAASRPEDVGNATAPITILIALTYFTAVAAVGEPDGMIARVVSFVPFMAPMTMLPRSAVGHVAPWEIVLSVALVLATTYATVRLGARVYAGGIRRPGPRIKLREAWRAAGG